MVTTATLAVGEIFTVTDSGLIVSSWLFSFGIASSSLVGNECLRTSVSFPFILDAYQTKRTQAAQALLLYLLEQGCQKLLHQDYCQHNNL